MKACQGSSVSSFFLVQFKCNLPSFWSNTHPHLIVSQLTLEKLSFEDFIVRPCFYCESELP